MPKVNWKGRNLLSDSVMGGGPDTALSACVEGDDMNVRCTNWETP
jgi:hypothetical protein